MARVLRPKAVPSLISTPWKEKKPSLAAVPELLKLLNVSFVPPKAFTNTVALSSGSVPLPVGKPSAPIARYPAPAPAPMATEELMAALFLLSPV